MNDKPISLEEFQEEVKKKLLQTRSPKEVNEIFDAESGFELDYEVYADGMNADWRPKKYPNGLDYLKRRIAEISACVTAEYGG